MRCIAFLVGVLLAASIPRAVAAAPPIEGVVVDAETNEPLAGVNVFAEGTTLGTVTDLDGHFHFEAEQIPSRLVFSFIGYETTVVSSARLSEQLRVELKPRMVDLRPVVVSASRVEERRTEAPVAIASLSSRDFERKKPDQLYEVLNSLPGVHVTSLGNEQHTMSVRQPLSYSALFVYLEDGIPIRPTGIFNHNSLIELNMAGAEHVEVVRGPSSSLYGPNAIGGAINFITPKAGDVPEARLQLRSDDQGYRRADFQASGSSGKLGIWAGGYLARQRDGWAEHSDFDKLSLTMRADYSIRPTTRLATTISTNHLNTDTNGNLDSLNFYGKAFSSLQTFTHRLVRATRVTSRLNQVWNDRQSSEFALYWRHNTIEQLPHYRIRNDRSDPTRARGELNEDSFRSLGLFAQHRVYFDFLSSRVITGLNVERSPNSYVAHYLDVKRDASTGRYVDYVQRDSLLTDYDVDLSTTGAYVQVEASPISRLKLVGSVRYDLIRYGFDNHLPPSAFTGAPDATDVFTRVSPRIGATYDLGGGHGVYGNASQGFVPPEINELYRGVKVPTLEPAIFRSYEVGGWSSLLDGKAYLDVSLYRMNGTNEIIDVLLDDGSTEARNAGRTRHTGIEYAIHFVPHRSVNLRFTGTNALHEYVRFEDGGDHFDGNRMDTAPTWMANGEVLYRPPFLKGFRVGLEWEHVGPYYMDPENTLEYDGYDVFALRTGYEIGDLEIWLNVHNLTDVLYANIASKGGNGQAYNPGGPRRIGVGVGYTW